MRVPLANQGWSDEGGTKIPGREEADGMIGAPNREVELGSHEVRDSDHLNAVEAGIEADLVIETFETQTLSVTQQEARSRWLTASIFASGTTRR